MEVIGRAFYHTIRSSEKKKDQVILRFPDLHKIGNFYMPTAVSESITLFDYFFI